MGLVDPKSDLAKIVKRSPAENQTSKKSSPTQNQSIRPQSITTEQARYQQLLKRKQERVPFTVSELDKKLRRSRSESQSELGKIKRLFGSKTTTAGNTEFSRNVGIENDLNTSNSELGKIKRLFGSDTTTAGNTEFSRNVGIENDLNTSTVPTTIYLDSKGDFSPIYSNTNSADSIFTKRSPIVSLTSDYSWPKRKKFVKGKKRTNVERKQYAVPRKEMVPGRRGRDIGPPTITSPDDTFETKYVYTTPTHAPTRLLKLHEEGKSANEGFTNTALPLGEYYARGFSNTDRLGYRDDDLGFDQPYIIRKIGDHWGTFDNFGLGSGADNRSIETIVKTAAGFIDSIGGAVLGRNPGEYIGSATSNIVRTGKFLLSARGVGFLAKQSVLMRKNKQRFRTDVRYQLTDNLLEMSQNPKKYNILSLGSLPGVTKISITKYDPEHTFTPYLNTIASHISDTAWKLSSKVGDTIINIASTALSFIGEGARKLLGGLGDKLSLDIPKISGRSLPKVDFKNLPTVNTDALKATAEQIKEKAEEVSNFLKEIGDPSKRSQVILDAKVFADVGADKVNLIPYGPREVAEKDGKTEEELDFIPFRFVDMDGNYIVFRAILSSIVDTFSPEYASERYVGRPDNVHVYQGTNREISFTFDVYPKSDQELPMLWSKLNYLAGLTYPKWSNTMADGGTGMIAPFCNLTIGDMYRDTPGYISALSYSVQDNGTWELDLAKLPKYIQVNCTFVYIGSRLLSSQQKLFEPKWISAVKYGENADVTNTNTVVGILSGTNAPIDSTKLEEIKSIRDQVKS